MTEFWVSSGHHFTRRTEFGALGVTDELLLAFLARPELMPPSDACDTEKAIYKTLLINPRSVFTKAQIEGMKDKDAVENWQFFLKFRDSLVKEQTVEGAYLYLLRQKIKLPVLFYNQLVHLILRNCLDESEDPFVLRAAELLFRPQKASIHEEALLLADEEVVSEMADEQQRVKTQSPLTAMLAKEETLDILTDETVDTYWSRSDAFTLALPLGSSPRAREALAKVLETWIAHLLGIKTKITPQNALADENWRWFIGLTQEATALGNQLWNGEPLEAVDAARMVCILKCEIISKERIDEKYHDVPVWLLVAMDEDNILRVKPQNLIINLPLKGLN